MQEIAASPRAEFSRSGWSPIPGGQQEAAPDTSWGPALPFQAAESPGSPGPGGQRAAAAPGWHSLACDATTDPHTRPGVGLSCLTADTPLAGVPGSPWGPSAGRAVCREQPREVCAAVVPGDVHSTRMVETAPAWAPAGAPAFESGAPQAFSPHPPPGCSEAWDGAVTPSPFPCSGKPRVLQHNYFLWSLAKPSLVIGSLLLSLTNNWQSVFKGRQCTKVAAF